MARDPLDPATPPAPPDDEDVARDRVTIQELYEEDLADPSTPPPDEAELGPLLDGVSLEDEP